MSVLVILAGLWLALGAWLTVDGMKKAWPRIRGDRRHLPAKVLGVVLAVIICLICLPARFFWMLTR